MDGSKIILLPNVETGLLVNKYIVLFVINLAFILMLSSRFSIRRENAKTPRLEVELTIEPNRTEPNRTKPNKQSNAIVSLFSENERKRNRNDLRDCYCYSECFFRSFDVSYLLFAVFQHDLDHVFSK